jgi:hypothetical protein
MSGRWRAASGAARTCLAGVLALTSLSSAKAADDTFVGTIIDATCARGGHVQMRMGPTDADCTRLCVMFHDDVYVLQDGDRIYRLTDQKRPEEFAGQKVIVTGQFDAESSTIRVESIKAAR